jgi:hypothetical protein
MVQRSLLLACAWVLASVSACSAQGDDVEGASSATSAPAPAPGSVEQALQNWNSSGPRCSDSGPFPNGGIQTFWCHRPDGVSLTALSALAGVNIFQSGPHRGDELNLRSPDQFGHYNPAFVQWLVDNGVSRRGSALQRATQHSYDAHLKPLAQTFYWTLEKATKNPACFEAQKQAYAAAIAAKDTDGFIERYFFFLNPFFCEHGPETPGDSFYFDNGLDGHLAADGNVIKSVVGFWLRRSMDGTMEAFAEGVRKLVRSYQPELLAPRREPSTTAITRAIDAGLADAAACKDAKATSPTASVRIIVEPSGKLTASLPAASVIHAEQANACVSAKFAAHSVPAFDGSALTFARETPVQ